MACPQGTTIRYDLDLNTDPENGRVKVDQLLTFCLIINGSVITGTVDQLGVPLTGTNVPLANGVDSVTLDFRWGASRVILRGFTFPESAERREYVGRFNAVTPLAETDPRETANKSASSTSVAPDPGDVGTGAGQQT